MVEIQIIVDEDSTQTKRLCAELPDDSRILFIHKDSDEAYEILAFHDLLKEKYPAPMLLIDDVLQAHCYQHAKITGFVAIPTKIIETVIEALREDDEG